MERPYGDSVSCQFRATPSSQITALATITGSRPLIGGCLREKAYARNHYFRKGVLSELTSDLAPHLDAIFTTTIPPSVHALSHRSNLAWVGKVGCDRQSVPFTKYGLLRCRLVAQSGRNFPVLELFGDDLVDRRE